MPIVVVSAGKTQRENGSDNKLELLEGAMEKRDLLKALDRMGCCNPLDLTARMKIAEPILAAFDALREERDTLEEGRGEASEEVERLQDAQRFVDHIQAHLDPGQDVICKICGKTIEEIAEQSDV